MNGPNRIFLLILLFLEISYVRTQSCIDTTLIDKSRANNVCNDLLNFYFDPICGCDGKIYPSPQCAKYLSGITSFSRDSGCMCIDPSIIDTSKIPVSLQFKITPECGCNGQSYMNKRIAYYRFGISQFQPIEKCECNTLNIVNNYFGAFDCGDDFISATGHPDIDWVCGCDSITYVNPCQAYIKGMVSRIIHNGVCHCIVSVHPSTYCLRT